jgi:hypothetical protein
MEEAIVSSAVDAAPVQLGTAQDGDEAERKLADQIRQLWTAHVEARGVAKRTRAELKAIREQLGERLFEMKKLLAIPGRNGGWSSFLRSEGIAKATADRLVRKHQQSIDPQPNIVSEEVSELETEDVGRLFDSLSPRLEKSITTPNSAYEFIVCFTGYFDLECELLDDRLVVLAPEI